MIARRRCFAVLDLGTITWRYRGLPKCGRNSSGCGVVGRIPRGGERGDVALKFRLVWELC